MPAPASFPARPVRSGRQGSRRRRRARRGESGRRVRAPASRPMLRRRRPSRSPAPSGAGASLAPRVGQLGVVRLARPARWRGRARPCGRSTTNFRGRVSTRSATKTWIRIDAPMMIGSSSRPMMNDLVRIADPNSVEATTQILRRIRTAWGDGLLRGGPGRGRRSGRRCRAATGGRSRSGRSASGPTSACEQVLRVSAPAHFLEVALVVDLDDPVAARRARAAPASVRTRIVSWP